MTSQRISLSLGFALCLLTLPWLSGCGSKSETPTTATANSPAARGGSVSGTYSAGTEENGIEVQFQSGRKVTVRTSDSPIPSFGYYEIKGDVIVVTIPGGASMELKRNGNALEGTIAGRPIRLSGG
jgi:hypothetical protein